MKITLYMATSCDGFIAKMDGDSDWVSEVDAENFEQQIAEHGCIIVGRKTFDQYQGDLYPVAGVTNIVMSSDPSRQSKEENVVYAHSPSEAISLAQQRGHTKALLIGGGITNAKFLEEQLIDEIILSIHPLILEEGIKLFEGTEQHSELDLLGIKELGAGLIQLKYSLRK